MCKLCVNGIVVIPVACSDGEVNGYECNYCPDCGKVLNESRAREEAETALKETTNEYDT